MEVQLSNGARARVAEVTEEHVTIDANHQLAGQAVTFDIELLKLTKVRAPRRRQETADHRNCGHTEAILCCSGNSHNGPR